MCGRYAFSLIDKFFERYSITHPVLILDPRFNVAPRQDMPVVYRMGKYQVGEYMNWGFIPFWNKEREKGERIINARAETVMDKAVFKSAFLTRRCLIPATGFYEWARSDGRTQPYYIHLTTEPVFSFAGLYDTFQGKDGKEHKVYTILTTRPNRLMQPIHNRMPVILHRRDENCWLSENLSSPTMLLDLLKPYPDAQMAMYPVSSAVNNPRNDTEECLRPVVEATGC